jgi:transposase-like protein
LTRRKKMRRYNENERRRLYDQVEAAREQGLTQLKACKQAGINVNTFMAWRKLYKATVITHAPMRRAYTKRPPPTTPTERSRIPVAFLTLSELMELYQ